MPTPNSNRNRTRFKASLTPTEAFLTSKFGDLHEVIPQKLAVMSQRDLVAYLSQGITVSQGWVSKWLRDNGYERIVKYVRPEPESEGVK